MNRNRPLSDEIQLHDDPALFHIDDVVGSKVSILQRPERTPPSSSVRHHCWTIFTHSWQIKWANKKSTILELLLPIITVISLVFFLSFTSSRDDNKHKDHDDNADKADADPIDAIKAVYLMFACGGFTMIFVVWLIMLEKERKLKQLLHMIGVSPTAYWFGWFLGYLSIWVAIGVAIWLALHFVWSSPVNATDGTMLALMILLGGINAIVAGFVLVSLCSRAPVAVLCAVTYVFAMAIVFLAVNIVGLQRPIWAGTHWFLSLFGNYALLTAFARTLAINRAAGSTTWSDFVLPGPDGHMSIGAAMMMLLIDTFVYALLAYYFDQVIPNENGVRRHPLFFLKQSFWTSLFSGKNRVTTVSDVEGIRAANEVLADLNANPNVETVAADNVVDRAGIIASKLYKDFSNNLTRIVSSATTKSADEKRRFAVQNLSLAVFRNEITAILGHNGAGKTTTIRMLTGQTSPTSGNAYILGNNIQTDEGLAAVQATLGVAMQDNVLWPTLTVAQHLHLFGKIKNLTAEQIRAGTQNLLQQLDLHDKLNAKTATLSGGQKRRLCLALALVGNPQIVFLDEPSSGVDPQSRRKMWDVLNAYKSNDRCVILTTHSMYEADILADRKIIVSKGKLRCAGTSVFLKNRFGVGYKLQIDFDPNRTVQQRQLAVTNLMQQITNIMPNSTFPQIWSTNFELLEVQLPKDDIEKYASIFALLESREAVNSMGITDFGVSMVSLEDVFIQLSKEDSPASTNVNAEADTTFAIPNFNNKTASFLSKFVALLRIRFILWLSRPVRYVILLAVSIALLWVATYVDNALGGHTGDKKTLAIPATIALPQMYTLALTFLTSVLVADAVYDKQTGARRLLRLSNANGTLYWLPMFMVHVLVYWIPFAIAYMIFSLIWPHGLFLQHSEFLIGFIGQNLLFLTVMTTLAYCVSLLFRKVSSAMAINMIFSIFIGLVLAVTSGSVVLAGYVTYESNEAKHIFVDFGSLWYIKLFKSLSILVPWWSYAGSLPALIGKSFEVDIGEDSQAIWTGLYTFGLIGLLIWLLFSLCILILAESISSGALRSFLARTMWKTKTVDVIRQHLKLDIDEGVGNGQRLFQSNDGENEDDDVRVERLLANESVESLIAGQQTTAFSTSVDDLEARTPSPELAHAPPTPAITTLHLRKRYTTLVQKFTASRNKSTGLASTYHNNANAIAVRNVSFRVQPNEIFGLLGPNGAGKTSIMGMLVNEIPSTAGLIYVDRYNTLLQRKQATNLLGYCPQFDALWGEVTVCEHLRLMAALHGQAHNMRGPHGLIVQMAEKLGLSDYWKKSVSTLSGGTRRKLSFLLSIIDHNMTSLLDEPSSGMDVGSSRHLWDIIKEHFKNRPGTSISTGCLLTTHYMEEAEALCDRIAIMVRGNIKCIGTPTHLRNKFGSGYRLELRLVDAQDATRESVCREIAAHFSEAILKKSESRLNRLVFSIPQRQAKPLSASFRFLESLRAGGQKMVLEYTITQASIEHVFLHIAGEIDEDVI